MAEDTDLEAKPGSQEILMAEVRYAIVFGEMNELFFGRLHRLLLAVTIFAGAIGGVGAAAAKFKMAAPSWLDEVSLLALVAAAVAFAIRQSFHFDKREAAFRKAREEFQDLEGKGWSMAQGTLQKELAKLRKNAPAGGSWLASSAFNRACAELGRPDRHRPVPRHVHILQQTLAS